MESCGRGTISGASCGMKATASVSSRVRLLRWNIATSVSEPMFSKLPATCKQALSEHFHRDWDYLVLYAVMDIMALLPSTLLYG